MAIPVNDSSLFEFSRFSGIFAQLSYDESDRKKLHSFLDEINALDLESLSPLKCQESALLVKQCCVLIPPDDTFLVAKVCQLISSIYDKQQVHADEENLHLTISWCLKALKECPSIASQDILSALETVVHGNVDIAKEMDILNILEPFLDIPSPLETEQSIGSPWDLRLQAIQCLESLVAVNVPLKSPTDSTLESLNACLKILIAQLEKDRHLQQDEINYCQALIPAIKGVENIVQVLGSFILGDALGVVKAFMLYGLPGHSGLKPQRVPCAPVSHSELSSKLSFVSKSTKVSGRSRPNRKRQKKKDSINVEDNATSEEANVANNVPSFRQATLQNFGIPIDAWPRTSDSEYSDTDSGHAAKIRQMQSRVRHSALGLMLTLTKIVEKKELFGYWSSLLPDGPGTPQTRTLMTCLLRDPSPRSRLGVLAILWTMLNSSRLYLLQAEHGDGSLGAFTPFSVCLGNMLHELHRCLCLALSAESSVLVVTQLLRVISVMIQNTPYHRLRFGLLTKIIGSIRGFVRHSDVNVQVAALTAFGSVVSVQPSVPELSEFLIKSTNLKDNCRKEEKKNIELDNISPTPVDGEENVEYEEDGDDICDSIPTDSHPPWILEICLEQTSRFPAPVRVERLQLIGALASHHFASVIAPNFLRVQEELFSALGDPEESVRLHAARSVEMIGVAFQTLTAEGSASGVSPAQVLAFWQDLLNGPLINLLQSSEQPNLRSSGCNCLASVGDHVFDQLPESRQIMCFTLLFGLASDEESLVRASAARALGVFVLFTALRKDIQFLVDCTEAIIRTAKDESFGVKLKASWSLGNLSDALVLNRCDQLEELPLHFTLELLKTSRECSLDNDKVRSNGVRALGNLLRLVTKEDLCIGDVKECVITALKALVQNMCSGSNMKVRWNACYAVGNVLKNSALYEGSINCQGTVFPALCNLVEKFRNFKVRINAALALAIPESRTMYGIHFLPAWLALLTGIDNSEYMVDFNEYKHRDGLLDQICRSLCHLASLVVLEDLVALSDVLNFHANTMKQLLQRIQDSIVPEHAGVYLAAANHTLKLLTTPGLTASQLSAATLLQSIFTRD